MDESQLLTEGFLEELNIFGISIDTEDIHWRCSFSQGDGLSFDIKNMNLLELICWLKAVIASLESEEIRQEKDPKQNGGTPEISYARTLLQTLEEIRDLDILTNFELYTSLNGFATYYCHEKTRDINIDYSYDLTIEQLDQNPYNNIDKHFDDIREYFKKSKRSDSDISDELSTKIFIKQYMNTVDLSHAKDARWHQYLENVLTIMD